MINLMSSEVRFHTNPKSVTISTSMSFSHNSFTFYRHLEDLKKSFVKKNEIGGAVSKIQFPECFQLDTKSRSNIVNLFRFTILEANGISSSLSMIVRCQTKLSKVNEFSAWSDFKCW